MLRRLVLCLAVCGAAAAEAQPQPQLELTATPAWAGWARPGRATELDLRVGTDRATRATLEVAAGRQTVHADLELQPGRPTTLHVPLAAAGRVQVTLAPREAAPLQREITVASPESPLLGVALADGAPFELAGFHAAALTAAALPHQVAAYAAIDALVIDAPTLAALEPGQLAALLGHVAGCGRVVVVGADANVRRVLEGAGGCSARALLHATTAPEAREMLTASLAEPLPTPLPPAALRELIGVDATAWQRTALLVASWVAVATLLALFGVASPLIAGASAAAALAALLLPRLFAPAAQLVVWSEAESGARLARHQALQRVVGTARGPASMDIPPLLAPSAQPCNPQQPMHLRFDAARGHVTEARFDTRLFARTSLCYAGSFPLARSIELQARPDGTATLVNRGSSGWPAGRLAMSGRMHALPALGPGASAPVDTRAAPGAPAATDAAWRMAQERVPPDRAAALWPLELAGVGGVPVDTRGWLLLSVPSP